MIAILVGGGVALLFSLIVTPLFIKFLVHRKYGQFIRQDGPTSHQVKRGTPTMGGLVIIAATVLGYAAAMLSAGTMPRVTGLLVLFLMVGMGLVGFIDDYMKISKQRSLGLSARGKFIGQGVVGVAFAVLVLQFPNRHGVTPASTSISFIRDTGLDLALAGATIGLILFAIWANFLVTAWSNAVNLTDGLDGLATGASVLVFGAYTFISIWQLNQNCARPDQLATCYEVRDPRDIAILAAAITGACIGFLWWNASPAKIFMGDTGSLALGGALAGLSIVTRTELLAVILGGLFVIIVASSVIQIGYFKLTGGKRVFKMAPLHHHFELKGWDEVNIVIRFWVIGGLCMLAGLGIFYAEWVVGA